MTESKVRSLVVRLYGTRKRRNGELAYKHPLRVGNRLSGHLRIAGYCHDLIEDKLATLGQLREMGIPEESVRMVHLLTRRNEPYLMYILFLLTSTSACMIKTVDIFDNNDEFTRPVKRFFLYPLASALIRTRLSLS